MVKTTIENNSVQATMVMPLWGRAKYSRKYPNLLLDPLVHDIFDRLMQDFNFDLSKAEKYYGDREEYFGLIFLARARNFDDALQKYLQKYPKATVINLGAGLDTGFSRNDNGQLLWYDIDLPNIIELRRKYIPETARSICISKSILDFSWMTEIKYNSQNGIFFIAGGLLMYFKEEVVQRLLISLSEKYPGGELIFDGTSKLGLKVGNKRSIKADKSEMIWYFYLKKPNKQINQWSPKIKVIDYFPYWARTKRNPIWAKSTIKLIKISTFLKLGLIAHIKFLK
ncbi:hypothetical protein NEF87_002345 [Candidatus Lokiarchaeum ossiferum]|uniref:Class I SAM-dependent methyltransferase n=1 Tax=Candidatus Lokiarchaeum ossiferum TaxID=2951803 RepID=A0ABY6HRC7_9ARCH|nr:hypothetical protein NEF87_002345 [Candidatus Lokiarchaeum sp. B-35]